ncbi:hypothetical protein FQN54_004057 [Arachnomyces sp. PD_36]|nr:hypothetical protein FQN54_004057 [Arachnomyces sp. PD_36]
MVAVMVPADAQRKSGGQHASQIGQRKSKPKPHHHHLLGHVQQHQGCGGLTDQMVEGSNPALAKLPQFISFAILSFAGKISYGTGVSQLPIEF